MKLLVNWQDLRPGPALDISVGVAKKAVSDQMNRDQKKYWNSLE
jgi:hypothetical protein